MLPSTPVRRLAVVALAALLIACLVAVYRLWVDSGPPPTSVQALPFLADTDGEPGCAGVQVDQPAILVGAMVDGRLDVFARAPNGGRYEIWWPKGYLGRVSGGQFEDVATSEGRPLAVVGRDLAKPDVLDGHFVCFYKLPDDPMGAVGIEIFRIPPPVPPT
jgi:hypothetical protein